MAARNDFVACKSRNTPEALRPHEAGVSLYSLTRSNVRRDGEVALLRDDASRLKLNVWERHTTTTRQQRSTEH